MSAPPPPGAGHVERLKKPATFGTRQARMNGGEGWIRTSVGRSPADLQSAAFNHSATSPGVWQARQWRAVAVLSTAPAVPRCHSGAPVSVLLPAGREMERVKGIEPSYSAWKAAALPLSYTRPFDPDRAPLPSTGAARQWPSGPERNDSSPSIEPAERGNGEVAWRRVQPGEG